MVGQGRTVSASMIIFISRLTTTDLNILVLGFGARLYTNAIQRALISKKTKLETENFRASQLVFIGWFLLVFLVLSILP